MGNELIGRPVTLAIKHSSVLAVPDEILDIRIQHLLSVQAYRTASL